MLTHRGRVLRMQERDQGEWQLDRILTEPLFSERV